MAIRGPVWFIVAALVSMASDTPGVFELWKDDELVSAGAIRDSTLRSALARELLQGDHDGKRFNWKITYHPARS